MNSSRTDVSTGVSPSSEPEAQALRDGSWRGPLRVLVVADPDACERLLDQLRRGGYDPIFGRVDTAGQLADAARNSDWDVAICHDDLPTLEAPAALMRIKTDCPWLPVIIVSSRFGESVAAAAMKAGADDFVSSGFLARLVPAVEREIRAARLRRGWKETAQSLADARLRSTAFMDNNPAVAFLKDEEGRTVYVNRTFERVFGISFESIRGKRDAEWLAPEVAEQTRANDAAVLAADQPMEFEEAVPTAAGLRQWLVFKFTFRDHSGRRFVGGVGVDITQRKRTEEALRASEELYRDWVEHTKALICVHDLEGRILTVNEAVEKNLGFDSGVHLDREVVTVPDVMAPETRPNFDRYIATIRARGSADGVMAVQTRTGEKRYWEYHNTLRTEGVEAPVVRGLAFDVTERLQAQEALRDSEQRFRTLVENGSDVIVLVGADGRIRYASPSLTHVLGYRVDELLGHPPSDFLHPEDAEKSRERLRTLAQQPGRVVTSEARIRHKDGSWRFIESVSTNHLAEPAIAAFVVNFRDITERRRSEEAIRASESRYRMLFERNLAGVYRSTLDGRIVECNEAFARIYGYASREEVLAVPAARLYPDPSRRSEFLEALGRQGLLTNYEGGGRRKDGTPVWTLENAALLSDGAGEGGIIEGTVVDVTDRRHLEDQLRQSQKMEAIGRLAGGVAHDFNNLLTAILGYSDMMLTQLSPDDPLREEAEEIRKAGERAAALTRQLLAFSRKQRLEPRVLDLNLLVGDLEKMLQRLIGEDVELVTSLDPDLGALKADPGQLEQVLMNLAVNARDAMPRGGKLTIQTANTELDRPWAFGDFMIQPGPYVMIAVTDTGTGMSEETKSHVFEPFFTTKGPGKGTGLGLATVYGIVKQSGGYIWVYSEPDAGTVFRIYLPRYSQAQDGLPTAASRVPQSSRRGQETILLVEDEEGVRSLARRILSMQGYAVLEASGPEPALQLLERHGGPIHLLLTDVVMPEMDGSELASRAAALRPETRVLFMSGYTDEAIGGRGLMAEGGRFLQKPFLPQALAAKVREILDSAPGPPV